METRNNNLETAPMIGESNIKGRKTPRQICKETYGKTFQSILKDKDWWRNLARLYKSEGFIFNKHGQTYRCTRRTTPYSCESYFSALQYEEATPHSVECVRVGKKQFIVSTSTEGGDHLKMNVSNIDLSNAADTDLRILGNQLKKTKQLTITVQPNYQQQIVQLTKDVADLSIGKGNNQKIKFAVKEEEKVQQPTQYQATAQIEMNEYNHGVSNSHCFVCFEISDDIKRTSCCNQLLHEECYTHTIQSKLEITKKKKDVISIQNLSKQEKQEQQTLRHHIARLCPHCKNAVPTFKTTHTREIAQLIHNIIPASDAKFQKAISILQKQVDTTQSMVFGEKLTLALLMSNEQQEVSQPSISVHGSDIHSNEITETFSEILEFGDTEIDDLTDAQTYELKRLRATEKALLEKMKSYHFQQIQQQQQYQSTIFELQTQLRQGEIEKEVELAEKLQALSMKEYSKGIQVKTAISSFKLYQEKLVTTEAWLNSLEYCKSNGADDIFKKIGEPICDAIVLPKCPLLFKEKQQEFKKMQNFFIQMGLPVSIVCQSAKKDCVFVQLDDGRNMFTPELLANIRKAMSVLTLRTYRRLRKQRKSKKQILPELLRLYVRQIDFTQDISGSIIFSLSLETPCTELFDAIRELGIIIGMPYSNDYNQLLTCIQYLSCDINGQTKERMKIYNKLVHFLTCGQFKKSLNMALDKLMSPSLAFYQNKIKPTLETGLSRIEYSAYFNSYQDYNSRFLLHQTYLKRVDETFDALNTLRYKFYYKISLELMLNSYFTFCKTQLVAFDGNVQMIAYSYNARSYTFAGVVNNKTRHSPSNLIFLKKYVVVDGKASIFVQGSLLGEINKVGSEMQIPIHSFNSKHEEKLVEFQQENLLFNISNASRIQINTGDKAIADFLKIHCQILGYIEDQEMEMQVQATDSMNSQVQMEQLVTDQVNQSELVSNKASLEFQINTDSPETKIRKMQEQIAFRNKRLAPAIYAQDLQLQDKVQYQQQQIVNQKKRIKKLNDKDIIKDKVKISYDEKQKRNLWEVRESDWVETQYRQGRKKMFNCLYCKETIRKDNRIRHNCIKVE